MQVQKIKILQVFLYSFESVDDFGLLETHWSAFSNVRLQVKYLFSTRISNDHPLILTSFNANEILLYLLA